MKRFDSMRGTMDGGAHCGPSKPFTVWGSELEAKDLSIGSKNFGTPEGVIKLDNFRWSKWAGRKKGALSFALATHTEEGNEEGRVRFVCQFHELFPAEQ